MGYVIAAILVVLIVAAAIGLFVRRATTRTGQATIAAPDEGPLRHEKPPSPGVGGPGAGGAGGEGEGSRPVQAERR